MEWLEVSVYTTDEGIEPVTGAFMGVGVSNLSIEESAESVKRFLDEQAPYWDFADAAALGANRPCVRAYLPDLPESDETLSAVRSAVSRLPENAPGVPLGSLEISVRAVDEEDWANNWKKNYKPMAIGRRLLVVPSWEDAADASGRVKLILDPGMAFGTGAHQTTRMCLELLEGAVRPGDTVLDLGCGSGILSIAALLLGAANASAVDIDPIARDISRENADRNGVDPSAYRVLTGNALSDESVKNALSGQYDLVLANIVADVIIGITPFAKACTKRGAPFIASGIISERLPEVLSALEGAGFIVERVLKSEDWTAVLSRG